MKKEKMRKQIYFSLGFLLLNLQHIFLYWMFLVLNFLLCFVLYARARPIIAFMCTYVNSNEETISKNDTENLDMQCKKRSHLRLKGSV